MSKFDGLFPAKGANRGSGKGKRGAKGGAPKPPADGRNGEAPRLGRPSGKRSDPDYVGFTTYIRKDTHHRVKRALFDEPDRRELSELVEELLAKWLKTKLKS